ncbi:hypothetical protein [Paraburkholderia xenovorans]|nr:hypothetical protein [Paraburkholderia xenovorans]
MSRTPDCWVQCWVPRWVPFTPASDIYSPALANSPATRRESKPALTRPGSLAPRPRSFNLLITAIVARNRQPQGKFNPCAL